MFIVLGWVGLLVVSNATLLALLRFGRMWALYFVIMLYSLFCLVALANISIVGIIIGVAVIYYSNKARNDYKRLSHQVGGIMM